MVRIDAVVEDFLTDKGKGQRGESGNYRQDAGRELGRFVEFLADREAFLQVTRVVRPVGTRE